MAAKRVSRALSPYAKAQRKAMRAAGIKPDPKPKFKIGNRVRVTDTSVVGTVTFIGSYDAYIGQYRYKIKDDDARGGQKYWNEDSLVKTSRKVENPSRSGIAKVELANDIRGGRNVGNLWGVARYTDDGRRGSYILQPQRSESVARAFAAQWNRDQRVENPSRKPIDHKFAGALFSAGHPKTALAYLRGTLTKSTARELAAGKKRR